MSNLAHLSEAFDKKLEKDAREDLTDRLKWGKQVGGFTLRELLLCDLQGLPTGPIAEQKAVDIVLAEPTERSLLTERWCDDVIEKFLDSKPEMIDEWIASYLRGQEEEVD